MNTHADKTQENKSQSVANEVSHKQSGAESTFQFVDNRPEAIARRKLQEMVNNSPQARQLRAIQEMANNSLQVKQAAQLQAMAENYSSQQQVTIQKKENNTGLPDTLKSGIESLSGYSMDDVKVHYNSDKPAQLQAHAYAQGTDIHLGPEQEKHLPHEAWHVVQQKQGRAKPTMQMKEKVNINDDEVLEREADEMGSRTATQLRKFDGDAQSGLDTSRDQPATHKSWEVASSSNAEEVIQRVKGGIEYTEDTPTMLWAYNDKPFIGNVAAHNHFTVGAAQMTGFRVGAGRDPQNADLGDWTNEDLDVLSSTANVKLTNDVRSAEWVIERHHADVPVDTMRRNLKADIGNMFQARDILVDSVNNLRAGHAGEAAIAPGAHVDTNAAPAVFIYRPGPKKGKAQITAKYANEDTIRRINKLNVSKYLTGTKVAVGEDIPRISGTASQALIAADLNGTTSFSTAEVLLTGLRNTSRVIPQTGGGGALRLTQNQVGIIKLMVLNDALATTMVRYQALVGQAQEKNIQRFFPKSRRDEYVKTIAQANLDAGEMGALQAEIVRTSAADAQLLFNNADPGALRTDEAFTELGMGHITMGRMMNARVMLDQPRLGVPHPADLLNIKTAVLGANGALLAQWINRASLAYTDLTAAATQHVFHDPGKANQDANDIATYGVGGGGDVGSVIETSRGFTPVAPGERGAIYEMREREINIDKSGLFNIGSLNEMNDAIDRIFNAVD